jgi:hypothetical protein
MAIPIILFITGTGQLVAGQLVAGSRSSKKNAKKCIFIVIALDRVI